MRIKHVAQALALTLVAFAGVNQALADGHSGAAFVPLRSADVSSILHTANGVTNTSATVDDYHYVIGDMGTIFDDVTTSSTRSVILKGRNNSSVLTCTLFLTRTSDGATFAGSASTSVNGTFTIQAFATIPAGNNGQEFAVQVQCGLPPKFAGVASTLYSALF